VSGTLEAAGRRGGLCASFPFKEQVVIDQGGRTGGFVAVEVPASCRVFCNHLADVLVMTNFNTNVLVCGFHSSVTHSALQKASS
jgi:hypothetical protein